MWNSRDYLLPLLLIVVVSSAVFAGEKIEANSLASSQIVEVIVDPPEVLLTGPDAGFSLLVHGKTSDGRLVDLTRRTKFRAANEDLLRVTSLGEISARADGHSSVELEVAGRRLSVSVEAVDSQQPRKFNFENDIEPLLSRFQCNTSGCHGKAEGQNGFKLSVFGFDPVADYEAIVLQGRGRRVFPADPARSLLLQKASGGVPHGGGIRITPASPEYKTLHDWIVYGMPVGSETDPRVTKIQISPSERVMAMGTQQALRVVATYSDGRQMDVTRLASFQSNNEALNSVTEHGLVTAGDVPGQAAVMASFMGAVDVFRVLVPRSENISDYPELVENNFIDRLVLRQLKKLNILPSEHSSESEYLRRVFLDVIGTLPTAEEAKKYLADTRPDRRARLVDELLQRPEYADYWSLKWADLLRVDREALGHRGAYAYYRWIHNSLRENKPLDLMAQELVTAEGPLRDAPQGHFYSVVKNPGEMASTLSQTLLGVRIACAQCHHHPFDRWSQKDYYGMQAYFQSVNKKASPQGEVILATGKSVAKHPRSGAEIYPFPLGGKMPEESPAGDQRAQLAQWLTSKENPFFARNIANRYIAFFFGRGLIEPVDDVRETNPASNPELLDSLAELVVQEGYNIKQVIRAITASRTYQRSTRPNATNLRDEQNYSRALFRNPDAEVLLDAVCQTTGVEEKFAGVPKGFRAIQLWDSQVSHDFLKLFGRPVRSTVCQCERSVEPSIAQVLHLLNSGRVNDKIRHQSGKLAELLRKTDDDQQVIEELYLTYYARYPNETERRKATEYFSEPSRPRQQAAEDLAWSLLNSLEFVFNH